MAKHLTDLEIGKVERLLKGWRGSLSWDALCEACYKEIGRSPSRQTLARVTKISIAYKTTKERLREEKDGDGAAAPPTMTLALQRIARLEAENAQLKAENDALLEQFVTWQYNAYKAGLSIDQLSQSLPPTDLRPS